MQYKIKELETEANIASENRVEQIFIETEQLRNQIKELQSKNLKQSKINLEHARQWYEWALKYLPKNSPEYIRAQNELNKILEFLELPKPVIPKKLEEPILPKKPVKPEEPEKPAIPKKPKEPVRLKKPIKPKKLVNSEITPILLIQSLQNLIRSLQYVSTFLT